MKVYTENAINYTLVAGFHLTIHSKKLCPLRVFCKQWLLAGEFSEFEYSRETRRFWRVRVLAKTAVF